MQVIGLSGSLRRDSYNRRALLVAGELLADDATFYLYDGLKAVPPYDEADDREPAPAAVARLRATLAGADAILVATPEYNASLPGQLKNALDWASRPFPDNCLRNKPVAVIGASTGAFGAVWAQAELKKVFGAAGARVVGGELALGRADRLFDQDGRLRDRALRDQLAEIVAAVLTMAGSRPTAAATTTLASSAAVRSLAEVA